METYTIKGVFNSYSGLKPDALFCHLYYQIRIYTIPIDPKSIALTSANLIIKFHVIFYQVTLKLGVSWSFRTKLTKKIEDRN